MKATDNKSNRLSPEAMKLFLLSQTENTGYDTYNCCVVAAENEVAARKINPGGMREWDSERECWVFVYSDGRKEPDEDSTWANDITLIQVRYIGEASPNTKRGIICASFNAG